MKRIEARVYGLPAATPRPRRSNTGGVYMPKTAEPWKVLVAAALARELSGAPVSGAVAVQITFLFGRTKRLQRESSKDGRIPHASKPDIDNLVKAVMDAATFAGVWTDDALVADLFVQKRYAGKHEQPGAIVIIDELTENVQFLRIQARRIKKWRTTCQPTTTT